MGSIGWFRPWSLRAKLGASAFVSLITTAALTGLLLLTAWTASTVVNTASLTHQKVRVYGDLETAVREYQATSYQSVREPGQEGRAKVERARRNLELSIVKVGNLPTRNGHDRHVVEEVSRQARMVLLHFRDARQLVKQVDAQWRLGGSKAALREVNRLSAPAFALESMLRSEIRRGDQAVTEATQRAQRLIKIAVIAALVGLFLAVSFSLIVQFLLHMRLRPGLYRLERGARAFGSGDLAHRINLAGTDDLASLANAFDRMATTISEKQAALHEVQVGLERAVAARTEELENANAKLSASDERRRAFLADVSHELRTPITVIRGETQVALRTADRLDFDPHEVFERILQQTRDLSRMVDDLFLIARAEAGGLPLKCRVLDLQEIAARVAADFATLASESGGSIRAVPSAGVMAFVDPDRVRRALGCLIENAMRHCQPGVRVEIEVHAAGDAILMAVDDDGPGINPAIAHELFERFRRGETRGEGSGLGLSLVSALVEAHGGRTYLEASRQGGTRAVMEFPREVSARAAA